MSFTTLTSTEPVIVGEIGSYAHGLATADSDHDFHGIFIEPPEQVIGVMARSESKRLRDKPEGVKSEAGDSETTLYGLHKYVKSALSGNPTMLTLLFTPTLTVPDAIGLQDSRLLFLNRNVAARHVGYADSMAARLTGAKAPRTNRPELIAAHGYDTKAAFHAIRLLIQGYEILTTGHMTMPMAGHHRERLLAIRSGKISEDAVLDSIKRYRAALLSSVSGSPLPEQPDYAGASRFLADTYMQHWGIDDFRGIRICGNTDRAVSKLPALIHRYW